MQIPSASNVGRQFDSDAQETVAWVDALQAVIQVAGPEPARFLLSRLSAAAQQSGIKWRDSRNTPIPTPSVQKTNRPSPAALMR